ncbi:MAG: hypothetical protein GY720_03440 [bacterium]|nr:hypothetical protein [bacterium]
MLNLDRSYTRREVVDSAGNPVVLVTERLAVRFGGSQATLEGAYERPLHVEHQGTATPIVDLVMIAKSVGLLLVLAATIVRTVRGD